MKTLSLLESIEFVKKHKIPFARHETAATSSELQKACEKIGYPIAMKVVSKGISHKTEAGGVKINIGNSADAKTEFHRMQKLKGFECVVIQDMHKGTEIIIGGKRDIQFGPTVLVGLGGIFVEIFKDANIGICPVSRKTAYEMVRNLKAYPILEGYRGKKGINIPKLVDTIMQVSSMMQKNPQIVELDLNPLIATTKGITSVDARVIIDE